MGGRRKCWLLVFALVVGLGMGGLSQVQTPSATLSTVIQKIQENPHISEKQEDVLATLFATAIEQGGLTPDQALDLLSRVGWDELTEEDAAGFAVRALELALIALTAGDTTYDEVLSALSQAAESGELGPLASGGQEGAALPGLFTSLLGPADEMSSDFWAELEGLVLGGLPPGIVARTVRQSLRSGATEEEVLAALEALGEGVSEGLPPGQAANGAASLGSRHQEEEENQNRRHGASPGGLQLREQSRHGPPEDRGKPEDDEDKPHGQGKGKGKKD